MLSLGLLNNMVDENLTLRYQHIFEYTSLELYTQNDQRVLLRLILRVLVAKQRSASPFLCCY